MLREPGFVFHEAGILTRLAALAIILKEQTGYVGVGTWILRPSSQEFFGANSLSCPASRAKLFYQLALDAATGGEIDAHGQAIHLVRALTHSLCPRRARCVSTGRTAGADATGLALGQRGR
jgi:hypothetical protein